MDSCVTVRDLKAEKANAIARYRRLRRVAALLRFLELGAFLIIISRVSSQLPTTFSGVADSLGDAMVALLSPRFVFVIFNAIVIALFANSGRFSARDPSVVTAETSSILDRYVKVCPENSALAFAGGSNNSAEIMRRKNLAEKYEYGAAEESRSVMDNRILRRSETEARERDAAAGLREEKQLQRSYSEDDMSNEEFRRKVEAFIARQQRFLREEDEEPALSS